ncbi:MAG: GAF domain-containing protein, partial [Reinekea sp.]|nr:GAF domain-containing protein [Reinekea sp.]
VDDYPDLQPIIDQPEIIIEHVQEDVPAAELSVTQKEIFSTKNEESSNHRSKIHTRATFPIVVRTKLIGILRVGHFYQRRDYTKNELQLAEAIISQATVSIENTQLFDQTQNTLAETQRLYDISRSLVEVTTLEDVFNIVIGNVTIYDVDRVSISLLDRNEVGDIETVTIVANWDSESDQILPVGSEVSADMFPLVEAFAQPPFSPLISEDLSRSEEQDPRMDEAFRRLMYEKLGAQTLFSAPMFVGSEYKGVLSISTRKPHTYTQQEMRIYQTLADQAIIAIERHRLLDATRQERDRAALLHEFAQKTSQTRVIEEVQDVVLDFTHQIGAMHGEIYVTDGSFFSMASTIPTRQNLSAVESTKLARTALSNGLAAEALQTGQPVLKNKSQPDWNVEAVSDVKDLKAVLCVPFRSRRSDLRGAITYFHLDENGFTNDQIGMFESIAMQTAETLENVWLLEQTANALNETELLYNATRDFNSAQHLEDLLATLVKSFILSGGSTEMGLDHMAIALISTTEEDGTPSRLNILANWDKQDGTIQDQLIINKPDFQILIENYPFI